MSNHTDKLIVVTGATGQQGGAAARHLLSKGWKVRALTRDVSKPTAKALAEAGAELFSADNDDRASLDAAFKGAYGVFSVQNSWTVGAEGEIRQGKHIADAAQAAGVKHFVYTSVGAAHRGMGQWHFASKYEIEQYIQKPGLPYTILRPVAFMENYFWQRAAITNGTFTGWGLRPDKGLQLIAVDDIGTFAEIALADPANYLGKTLEIAGDELTEPQIAAALSKVIGRPVQLAQPSMPEGAQPTPEQMAMGQFFNGQGYDADIPALRKVYPPLKTFEQWLRATGWENAEPMPVPEASAGLGQ
jgi:uncharacterized protein YbjT (DUF2867 family)